MVTLSDGNHLFVRDCISIATQKIGEVKAVVVKFYLKVIHVCNFTLDHHNDFRKVYRTFG